MENKKMPVGKGENTQDKEKVEEKKVSKVEQPKQTPLVFQAGAAKKDFQEPQTKSRAKREEPAFNSVLSKPKEKLDGEALKGAKPDLAVISAFKAVVAENGKKLRNLQEEQRGKGKNMSEPSALLADAIAKRKEFLETQGKLTVGQDGKDSKVGLGIKKADPMEAAGKKPKKEAFDMVEMMPNRSWVTNFYHNYAKAIERADLSGPGKNRKVGELSIPTHKEQLPGKGVESPFQSIMFVKPLKHDPQVLQTMKPDFAVIAAYKQILSEKGQKTSQREMQKDMQAPSVKTKGDIKPELTFVRENSGQSKGFTMGDVPFSKLEKLGVGVDMLKKNGNIERMLKGEMVPMENLMSKNSQGEMLLYNAAFGLIRKPNGDIGLQMSFSGNQPGQKIPLPDKALGITITQAMKEDLQKGKPVPFQKEEGTGKVLSMLVVDAVKNMLNVVKPKQQSLKIPNEINGVKLDKDQKGLLSEGKPIRLSGLTTKNGTRYDATVQINPEKKALSFSSAIPSSMVKIAPDLKDKEKVDSFKGLKREPVKRDLEEVSERKGKGMKM